MKADAIAMVEAAYDCKSETRSWLERLLEVVAPNLDRGFGVAVATYQPDLAADRMPIASRHMDTRLVDAFVGMCLEHSSAFHRAMGDSAAISTVTKSVDLTQAAARSWAPYVKYMHPFGVRDVTGVLARDPSGHLVAFNAPMPDLRRPTRRELAMWSRVAAHISAGARFRRSLRGPCPGDVMEGAEAVLSPSGSTVHCEGDAQSPDAREWLRQAAKAIDRARSTARSNDDEALDLWQGLVAGRWSLIERFDSDGRRFLVARKNDPQVTDPRALGLRERQVLAYVAMGHPAKLIAYSLGLSPSSVSTTRRSAMRKLGLQTTADVVRLFARAVAPVEPTQER